MMNELLNSKFVSVDIFGENYKYIEGKKFDAYDSECKSYITDLKIKYENFNYEIVINYWHTPINAWKKFKGQI